MHAVFSASFRRSSKRSSAFGNSPIRRPPLAILNGMAMVVDEDNLVGIDNRLVLHGVDGDKNMFCCAAIQ
jgi:hypothetical protein